MVIKMLYGMKKDKETIKKDKREIKNAISEINNTLKGIKSRLYETEDYSNDLEDNIEKRIPKQSIKKETEFLKNQES